MTTRRAGKRQDCRRVRSCGTAGWVSSTVADSLAFLLRHGRLHSPEKWWDDIIWRVGCTVGFHYGYGCWKERDASMCRKGVTSNCYPAVGDRPRHEVVICAAHYGVFASSDYNYNYGFRKGNLNSLLTANRRPNSTPVIVQRG